MPEPNESSMPLPPEGLEKREAPHSPGMGPEECRRTAALIDVGLAQITAGVIKLRGRFNQAEADLAATNVRLTEFKALAVRTVEFLVRIDRLMPDDIDEDETSPGSQLHRIVDDIKALLGNTL